jgi:hypothetical protein
MSKILFESFVEVTKKNKTMQTQLFLLTDQFLISFYHLTGIAIADYLIGTASVSFFCVLIGQATYFWVYCQNHHYLSIAKDEMVQMHTLSIHALKAQDKYTYTSCNSQANDAFGKYFFFQIATGMAAIWPLPFALAWMQMRFGEVDFVLPWIGVSVGYQFTIFPIYILVWLFFNIVKSKIPHFELNHP